MVEVRRGVMDVVIVGGGMAGLACAQVLVQEGAHVVVLDKGRGPGGRMATRRLDAAGGVVSFDHGAQYFTAREPMFVAEVARWQEAGIVAPWQSAGADAWVGTPKMSVVVEHMAKPLSPRWATTVARIERVNGGFEVDGAVRAERIVVATPAEQAAVLLAEIAPVLASAARSTPSSPCWCLMVAFAETVGSSLDIVRGNGAITWAARNSAKPGRDRSEAWVLHASPDWSREHLEDDATAVADALLAEFARGVSGALPAIVMAKAHRWRYAKSGSAGLEVQCVDGVGVAGDWLRGPRVEDAWLSGRSLAAQMLGSGTTK